MFVKTNTHCIFYDLTVSLIVHRCLFRLSLWPQYGRSIVFRDVIHVYLQWLVCLSIARGRKRKLWSICTEHSIKDEDWHAMFRGNAKKWVIVADSQSIWNGPKRMVHFSANHNFLPKVIQKRKLSSEMSDCRVRLPF